MAESRRSVERWRLTLPQFDVLAELERAGPAGFTFGELSRLLLVTSGNLTGIVDRLESIGLARRQSDKRDRRVVRIVLSPKGRRLAARILPLHARDIQNALAFMPTEDLRTLCDLLGAARICLRDRFSSGGDARNLARSRSPVKDAVVTYQGRAQGRHRLPMERRLPAWRDEHEEG